MKWGRWWKRVRRWAAVAPEGHRELVKRFRVERGDRLLVGVLEVVRGERERWVVEAMRGDVGAERRAWAGGGARGCEELEDRILGLIEEAWEQEEGAKE